MYIISLRWWIRARDQTNHELRNQFCYEYWIYTCCSSCGSDQAHNMPFAFTFYYQFDGHNNKFTRTHSHTQTANRQQNWGENSKTFDLWDTIRERKNRCEKKKPQTTAQEKREAAKRGNTIMNNISKIKCVCTIVCMKHIEHIES